MYIATLKTVEGFSEYAQFVDLFTDFMKQLPDGQEGVDYVVGSGQYKMVDGATKKSKYPDANKDNEILLVVDSKKQALTDILLAQLGLYPEDEFLNIAKRAMAENDPENELYDKPEELEKNYPYSKSFEIDDLIGKELIYYPHNTIYSYGANMTTLLELTHYIN